MAVNISDSNLASFPQQGTVDWIKLGKTGVTATVAILSRISAAHVDPFTLTVAQAIADQYKLSSVGKARMNECLQSLRSYTSLDGALWFGFGRKHIVHILASTTQGICTVALCGGLSEVLSPEVVASVLDELPATYQAPTYLRPSLLQWSALVSNCSGVVSTSNFALVAEHFMSLDGEGLILPLRGLAKNLVEKNLGSQVGHLRDCGQPKDVARALQAIGKLSSGNLIGIELRGGAICGLLAAWAYWFLGLAIEIRKGGTLLYRSVSEDVPVQLLVTYAATEAEFSFLDTQLASQSYYVCNISSFLQGRSLNQHDEGLIMAGRIPWDKAIQITFGAVGQELLNARFHSSQIFGNGARILGALANSESNSLGVSSSMFRNDYNPFEKIVVHNEECHGKGLILSAIVQFSELASLDRHLMEECLENPLAKACEEYESAITRLAMLCDPTNCRGDKRWADIKRYKRFCIPSLAQFLLITARNLALVHPEKSLRPHRAGLECLYTLIGYLPQVPDNSSLDNENQRPNSIVLLNTIAMVQVFQTAELIFTGRLDQGVDSPSKAGMVPAAYSANGMTIYLDLLREFSDSPGAAAMVHVVPGNLGLESGRTYNIARDSDRSGEVKYEATNYQPQSSLPSSMDTSSAELAVNLVVKESIAGLFVDFCFTLANKPLCSIGPTELLHNLAHMSYSVDCSRRQCPELKTPLDSVFTVEGEGKVDPKADVEAGRLVVIRRLQGNPIARSVALNQIPTFPEDAWNAEGKPWQSFKNEVRHENIILRSDECWSCCIKAALRHSKKARGVLPVVYIL
ncbi:hypothetical protein G7Y79_00010g028970 [Physcia stellaris]|nr:hypothetical protein G7Y79_00010g028970 [Physcia stellaris]